jgi:GDP-L-fucose synthase
VVTGGTGFLGGYVLDELQHAGARAIGVGSGDYDLRDRAAIDRMLTETKPDGVIHLASVVGGIGANRAAPGRFFYENALIGIQLLEACRVAAIPKVVVAGTVCSYPKHTPVPFREADLWNGYPEETNAPYGLAKKMLLVQAQAYRTEYGCNFVSLLPVNLYGPGDNFDLDTGHVIPAMIRRFLAARDEGLDEVVVWGDGTATREFLYVDDAARAFRLALEHYDAPDPVNIGSGEEIAIKDLAVLIAELCGFDGRVVWDTSKPNGQPRRRLDTRLANESFGFEATTALREGLRRTITWFSARV